MRRRRNTNWFTTFSGWTKTIICLAAKLFSDPSVTIQRARRKKSVRNKKLIHGRKQEGLILEKVPENPIIEPNGTNGWEAWQTFNPGAVLLGNDVHFLYRAVGTDGISRLGYAVSHDGLTIDERLTYPIYEHAANGKTFNLYSYASGGSWGGAEDPRLVRVGNEDILYMTYTACHGGGLSVGLTSISVDDFINHQWNWTTPVLLSPYGQIHKNWLIFPEKINGSYALLHNLHANDLSRVRIEYITHPDSFDTRQNTFESPDPNALPDRPCAWHNRMRSAGPPPIKTPHGWLLFYHATDIIEPHCYKIGAMLLDLKDPTKILYRSKAPILKPSEQYEYNGFKGGIVYASGAVVKDGTLFVYYGSADSYVCAATADFEEFMSVLLKDKVPTLGRKVVRRKK